MSNYSMTSYRLDTTTNLKTLNVINAVTSVVTASFDLTDSPYQIECGSGNYQINPVSLPGGFTETFDPDGGATIDFPTSSARMIGVTDLRIDMRLHYDYDLSKCPVTLFNEDDILQVQSPCGTPCNAPLEQCATIEEVPES